MPSNYPSVVKGSRRSFGYGFVNGLVTREQSLEKMIEKRAFQMAKEIVLKTSHTIHLENQGIDQDPPFPPRRRLAGDVTN